MSWFSFNMCLLKSISTFKYGGPHVRTELLLKMLKTLNNVEMQIFLNVDRWLKCWFVRHKLHAQATTAGE